MNFNEKVFKYFENSFSCEEMGNLKNFEKFKGKILLVDEEALQRRKQVYENMGFYVSMEYVFVGSKNKKVKRVHIHSEKECLILESMI